jgi:peroxiredoxin
MDASPKRGRWASTIPYVLILLLCVEVVALMQQNQRLKTQIARGATMGGLAAGDRIQPISTRTMDGRADRIAFDDAAGRQLLFVLSTTCPHCEKNLAPWREIAEAGRGRCRVTGVSIHDLETTRHYAGTQVVGFDLVSAADSNFTMSYNIPGVPETILLGPGGVVLKTWLGELTPAQTREIKQMLSTPTTQG